MAFFFHFLLLAEKQMRFKAKDSAIHEQIAPLRANHIARITSDFTMDLINKEKTSLIMFRYINNMLPVIFNNSFTLNKDLHKHNTRARDKIFDKIYL